MIKEKIIYSKRIAIELRKRGFRILDTRVNEHYPEFDCWVFADTIELQEALSELM